MEIKENKLHKIPSQAMAISSGAPTKVMNSPKKGRKINTTLPSIFRLRGRRGNGPHKMPLSKTVNKNIVWTPLEDVTLVGRPSQYAAAFFRN